MIKSYRTIELLHWATGCGITSGSTYESEVIEVDEKLLHPGAMMDFSWWIEGWSDDEIRTAYESSDNADVQITVRLYRADYDPSFGDEPLASWSAWESEILADYIDSM